MLFRIDLKIFLFLILFYFTKQVEIYAVMLFFALIHETGHLLAGLIMGMKPEKLELIPYGVSISFKINPKEYNKKIINGNILEIKKIVVAIAGPLTNLIIMIIAICVKANYTLIYVNLILTIFNLVPIYPLDGGRILKGALYILFGKRKSIKYIRIASFSSLIIITATASIGILYINNISIFIIIIFLWLLYIRQEKIENKRNKIYNLIDKTIEIKTK